MPLISELNTYASNLPATSWVEIELASGAPAKISPESFFAGIGNITGLGVSVSPTDRFLMSDVSASGLARYVTTEEIFRGVGNFTALSGLAGGSDMFPVESGGAARKATADQILGRLNGLTSTTDPQLNDKILIYDTSASAVRALTGANFFSLIGVLSQFTAAINGAADRLFYFEDGVGMQWIAPDHLGAGVHTLVLPAAALRPRQSNGCAALATLAGAANQPDTPYLAYDGAAAEYATFGPFFFGKAWDAGTIKARVKHRRASGTGAANVVWGIRAVAVGSNESVAVNFGTGATVTAPCSTTTANWMLSDFTGDCTIAGSPAKGDAIYLEVYRDGASGSDTLNAVDAWLSTVELVFTTNARDDS